MIQKIRAFLELMRPANIVTAFADVLAGFAAVGGTLNFTAGLSMDPGGLGWLLISTFGLYGGGVVLNDVFDAELDAKERPERAIPSGRVSRTEAAFLGSILHAAGILAAFFVNPVAGIFAVLIMICTVIYDSKAKHSVFWGPFFMGLCRGGNLLLGCSVLPIILLDVWFLALLPIIYIASITLISRGEVAGGTKIHGNIALAMISIVVVALLLLSLFPEFDLYRSFPFLILFAGMIFPPFLNAARDPEPLTIRKAVKRGVLSLMLLNSVIAAGFGGFLLGLIILGLLLLSILLSKVFAVT